MKKGFVLQSLICLLAVSCSVHEMETTVPVPAEDDVFYASLESYSVPDTRVYVDVNTAVLDENQKTLFLTFWDAEDQISIFNKSTLNKKYEFLGETGDNSGYFKMIADGTGTESSMDYVCAVYPYQESTLLDDSGVLTLTLPAKQNYRESSFGSGANTMVSTTDPARENNLLRFKNVGGYLVLKFYGEVEDPKTGEMKAITLKSIKLEGRNGEPLSGKATMTPALNGDPTIEMAETAGTSITLDCNKVKLGRDEENATVFWMVVPPTKFTQGITVTVTDKDGKVFIKETDKNLNIERNRVSTLKAVEVKPAASLDPNKVIYYTTSDKQTIAPSANAIFGEDITMESNDYVDVKGIMVFNGEVTQIGVSAFAGCENLTGMIIPETVTTIGESAFAGCTRLGAPNNPTAEGTSGPAKAPIRPDQTTFVIPEGVTSIGAHAFEDCTSLTSIIIPEGVTTIGAYAFTNCTSLTSITIPNSVTSIGEKAFAGCTNLLTIDIPENVEMGNNVFFGRTEITSVTIPEGTTSIGDYAYAGCENLAEVIIPDSVTSIGDYAFYMCSSLTGIDIPSLVTSIGKHAFDDCENLVSITIPDGVTEIEDFAFAACMALPSINIPDGVTSIGSSAFESCFKLADVDLPSSVESIGSYAFASCHAFTTFTIPSKVTQINDGLFDSCYQLSNVIIHNEVESIGNSAFSRCSSLTDISIPEAVTTIGENAFSYSGLTSITIPAGVTSIGNWVLQNCESLTSITVHANTPPIIHSDGFTEGAFQNTNDCPIYVPAGSVNAYREANGWSQYASRIYSIGSPDGEIQGHAYVDMGTGLKWATMNVGATSSVDPGVILPWSEGKAAAKGWGESWRLPKKEELEILMDESRFTWILDRANNGYTITSKIAGYVGNSIFLPLKDAYDPSDPDWYLPGMGYFWSSTPADGGGYYYLQIDDADVPYIGGVSPTLYYSIRPVAD